MISPMSETNRRALKIRLFKVMAKGRHLCHYCLKRASGKNMFRRARRGTC